MPWNRRIAEEAAGIAASRTRSSPTLLIHAANSVAHEQCQSAYPGAAHSRTDRVFSQGLVPFREHMTIEGWRAGSYRAFFFKRARVRFTVR